VVLEIVKPQGFLMARMFPMYFRIFTPVLGSIFAGEREAYDYLPQSVQGFKTASELAVTMENGGLRDVNVDLKALGTVAIVSGRKPG
ncbi:MAG: class I SAM-dependent methyltransferase, partial [Chloroflexota bacterium]|nr:class I SAM-dependent methyltransferase [Chloroflexota bacterium]